MRIESRKGLPSKIHRVTNLEILFNLHVNLRGIKCSIRSSLIPRKGCHLKMHCLNEIHISHHICKNFPIICSSFFSPSVPMKTCQGNFLVQIMQLIQRTNQSVDREVE